MQVQYKPIKVAFLFSSLHYDYEERFRTANDSRPFDIAPLKYPKESMLGSDMMSGQLKHLRL